MPLTDELRQLAQRVSNWGRWGADDQRGTLNLITPDVTRRGLSAARTGETFSLAIPFDQTGPQWDANNMPDRVNPELKTYAVNFAFTGDPADRDSWVLKNGDDVIARHRTDELRFLVHWSAEVFTDFDELKKNMDGSDDLTIDKAIDMMVDDLASKGVKLDIPSAPLHDPAFIGALNAAYDIGGPASYPEEAPLSAFQF